VGIDRERDGTIPYSSGGTRSREGRSEENAYVYFISVEGDLTYSEV
jgi:hypothetical protein